MFGSTARCLFLPYILYLSAAFLCSLCVSCFETDNKISIWSRAMARPKVKTRIGIYVLSRHGFLSDR